MNKIDIPDIALSVRQPWAWALVQGHKPVENRVGISIAKMRTGCNVAIHAAQGMTRDEYENARDFMRSQGVECPHPSELVRGAIIGTIHVDGKVDRHTSPWFFGPCALVVSDPVALDEVIPAKGKLGYFKWELSTGVAEVKPWMKAWPDQAVRNALEILDINEDKDVAAMDALRATLAGT